VYAVLSAFYLLNEKTREVMFEKKRYILKEEKDILEK
jgi:hypothetical protein